MKPTEEIPQEEFSEVLNLDSRREACAKVTASYEAAVESTHARQRLDMEILNAMREAGVWVNVACGRKKLKFSDHGTAFVQEQLLPELPGMDLRFVKACVHVASLIDKPLVSPDQVSGYQADLKLSLSALGHTTEPERVKKPGEKRNMFIELAGRLLGFGASLRQLYKEDPIEKWDAMKVHIFRSGLREQWELYNRLEERDTFLKGEG